MAISKVPLTDAFGNEAVPSYTWAQKAPLPYTLGTAAYQVFGRIGQNNAGLHSTAVFLLANLVGISAPEHGVFIICANVRNGEIAIKGTQLTPLVSGKTIEWGYYLGSDGYWYIGAKRPTYSPIMTAYLLGAGVSEQIKPAGVDNYYNSTTAPSGWTAITLTGGQNNVIQTPAVVNVASIAALKTQMSTWYTEQGANSVGFYNVAFTAAASPFSAGARVNVQINAAANANNGVATLTYYGASSPEMYLMRLYNGTWGDPKKVTVAT